MEDVLASPWGRLFRNWETADAVDANGYPDVGSGAGADRADRRASALRESIGILGTCIKEAPEFCEPQRTRMQKPHVTRQQA